jgi:hypothetical protein
MSDSGFRDLGYRNPHPRVAAGYSSTISQQHLHFDDLKSPKLATSESDILSTIPRYAEMDKPKTKLRRKIPPAPVRVASMFAPALLRWDDIDDSQTLDLGDPGGTSIVFTKESSPESHEPSYFVLRCSAQVEFTPARRRLLELASADEDLFLAVRCVLHRSQKVYVGTELSDMSLADIIDCTISINEIQLSAILSKVSSRITYAAVANQQACPSP